MKYHPAYQNIYQLSEPQFNVLEQARREEQEQLPIWWSRKVALINRYFQESHLDAAVIGISGGIDSALVLGLAHAAASQPGSRIKRIEPIFLPVYNEGATGQGDAYLRAKEWVGLLGYDLRHIDLTSVHQAYAQAFGQDASGWAAGQMVSYARTPALYYATSLLSDQGLGSIVLGTTNYDEGSYIGYFGKASDGMVDLQCLSDWHKHEVRWFANYCGVSQSIQKVAPTGDMFDGRTDESVFGFTYDALEYDLRSRYSALPPVEELRQRVDALHQYNGHKYLAYSPAIHLNSVLEYPRSFEGHWKFKTWTPHD